MSLSKLIQPVSCQTEMGARRRLLCVVCTGVPGEGLFVYMLSVSWEVPGEGMSVECNYICMDGLSFYTRILS